MCFESTHRDEIVRRLSVAGALIPGKRIKFDLGSAGSIVVDGIESQVSNSESGAVETTFTIPLHELAALVDGRIDPITALMLGKLKTKGAMELIFRLREVFMKVRA
jgi:putative sterol carrier protein